MELGMIGFSAFMLAILAVPILLMLVIGVVVYKDAKAHDLNPWLWMVVAVFTPNLIGVIIYLVVRSNQEKKYTCSNCNAEVKADYNVCPNCQAIFENTCEICKHALGSQMAYCPYCGAKVEENIVHQTATKVTKKTNLVKPLAIIGGICIAAFIAIFGLMFVVGATGGEMFNSSVSIMSVETSMGNHLKASFHYQTGRDSIKVKKQVGDTLVLRGDIKVEEGVITLTVKDPHGEVVYNEVYTGSQELEQKIPVYSEGKYTVGLKMDGAKGGYDLRAE